MVNSDTMNRKNLALIFLIGGLAFVFGWFGIDKFVHPTIWIGFLPTWMDGFLGLSKNVWIVIVGASEILFAVMILVPVRIVRQAGTVLIALHLVAVLWQVGWNDIGVRDLGLFASSLALFFLL